MESPCVRFDDLSPGGAGSFGLADPGEVFVAVDPAEVAGVLAAAERAAQSGAWVAGFVSYEASPAFDPSCVVKTSGGDDPMNGLPLAHFQAFGSRIELEAIESLHFPAGAYNVSAWSPDSSRQDYRDSLAMTGRAILAGEIVRGKHTFRLHAAFSGDPGAFYRDLLLSQRGPYGACIDLGRFHLISASPERFFKRAGETLTVSPVLGSVRRGRWLEEDQHLASVLLADGDLSEADRVLVNETEAELAELGELSAIPVEDRLIVERLEMMWHLTVKAGARLAPGVGLVDTFRALFPALSVTGVPKLPAMQLIATTEDTPRGVYCGAVGFLAPAGHQGPDASFSVAVRTVVVDQEEGVAEFGVGTPITGTSDVVTAYEEARLKARVLVDRRPEFRVYERFRVENGIVRAVEAKTTSLLASARYFGFDVEPGAVAGTLRGLNGLPDPAVLTLFVDRAGGVETDIEEAPPWSETFDTAPEVTAVLAEQPVPSDNVFLFHRTTDGRLREAATRAYGHADAVVLCNDHEELAGSLDANVAVRIADRWLTPPRGCGNPVSAFLARLIETGEIREAVVTRDRFEIADQIALIDDVFGWRNVALIG